MSDAKQMTPIRLPVDLKKYLQDQATSNFRSLAAEIAHRLEQSRQRDVSTQQARS